MYGVPGHSSIHTERPTGSHYAKSAGQSSASDNKGDELSQFVNQLRQAPLNLNTPRPQTGVGNRLDVSG